MNLRLPSTSGTPQSATTAPDDDSAGRVPAVHRQGAVAVAVSLRAPRVHRRARLLLHQRRADPRDVVQRPALHHLGGHAAVLIGAAVRGPRIASTVMIVPVPPLRTRLPRGAEDRLQRAGLRDDQRLLLDRRGAHSSPSAPTAGSAATCPPTAPTPALTSVRTRSRRSPTPRRRRSSPSSGRSSRPRSRWSTTSPRPISAVASQQWRRSAPGPAVGGCGPSSTLPRREGTPTGLDRPAARGECAPRGGA